jgi:hypothetical protein
LPLLLASPPARAQSTDQTLAQTLFDDAMKLMVDGNFNEACPKLAESQKLDPGGGTLFNLAKCREKEGKLASAWSAYDAAVSQSIKDGRKEREAAARERLAAIAPMLAKVTIVVPKAVRVDGLAITLDGASVPEVAWSLETPIDVGAHAVVATAPHKLAWKSSFQVKKDGDRVSISVVPLDDAPVEATPNPNVVTTTAPPPPQSKNNTAAWVVGGAGVASLVIGGIVGIVVLTKKSESDNDCLGGPNACNQQGVDAMNEAQALAWVSDIAIGAGVIGLGASLIMFLTAKPSSPSSSARVVPLFGPRSVGLLAHF